MKNVCFTYEPLTDFGFGVKAVPKDKAKNDLIKACLTDVDGLKAALDQARGLMLIQGLGGIQKAPQTMVHLSSIFGQEIEDYYATPTAKRYLHDAIPEILVLSNMPPCDHPPPPRPDPAYTEDGQLVVSYPMQSNWHTDQSYRRPPPDITLLLGLITPPQDQGQTLFADCTKAFSELDERFKSKLRVLEGVHSPGWIGRREEDVRNDITPKKVMPHQLPQKQPLVRLHPETGEEALYVCEERQMDFVDGPIVGLSKGPDGDGAKLLRQLLAHTTQQKFTYAHHWSPGDLIIADNRSLLHAATWYDANQYERLMWRTTVMGNPGTYYDGEIKSWMPKDGVMVDHGMDQL